MKKFFDFKCDNCGHRWEEYTSADDGSRHLMCLQCHSVKVRRLISAPMIGGETPYKTLDKHGIPESKIFSGPHHRSK